MSLPSRPVAFYVHHHGAGHANRCRLMAREYVEKGIPVHVFTSATDRFEDWKQGTVHALPLDVDPQRDPALDLLEGQVIHYGPVDLPDLQRRMAIMAAWIAEHNPSLFIVDLSVEVALFVRLCGVRVALVRLHGHRDDPAHVAAFHLADQLIAPFPRELEDAHTPDWVRKKTRYLGIFSRYDDRRENKVDCRKELNVAQDQKLVTVINGLGGGAQVQSKWVNAAMATPDWHFMIVGRVGEWAELPPNLTLIGAVNDTFPYLKAADVVVGSGGTNTMMEILAAGVPYLSMPEPRPFDEQLCKMRALEKLGRTKIVDEDTKSEQWKDLLEAASGLGRH